MFRGNREWDYYLEMVLLMGQIAYVAQDNYLFDMSVMDNIRLGKKGATDENVIQLNKKIWEATLNEKY